MTTYNTKDGSSVEYLQRQRLLDKLNTKLCILKSKRTRPLPFNFLKTRMKKKQLSKIDIKKRNLVDSLHWDTINDILKCNDVILMGDIKSHDIVKGGWNKKNNRSFNDLKFYTFKQRLLYKTNTTNRKTRLVNEAYTSQGCSSCGRLYKIKDSKIYNCKFCGFVSDRDTNSAKNIV